jgi:hypothetical protein
MSDGKRGVPFWVWLLLLLPVALFVLGAGSALAIYGVRKYMAKAKLAEADAVTAKWAAALVSCGERDGVLPPSTTPIPADLASIRGTKYQSGPREWSEPAHTCGGFSIKEPQYFQYSWERITDQTGNLHALADLDGNGLPDASHDVSVTCSGGSCSFSGARGMQQPRTSGSAASSTSSLLNGAAVDLSTVMGRARKLADGWQREAALLGVEATLSQGKVQTQDGATAKVTFGPSPFAAVQVKSGLFVVTYDRSGIRGEELPGNPTATLPEPMCAPERVLARLPELAGETLSIRYVLDEDSRPLWQVASVKTPEQKRWFDPQDCTVRGIPMGRRKR